MRRPLPTLVDREPAAFGGRLVLTVTEGDDRGRSIIIDDASPPLLIGRSPACELRLEDAGVSRRHASIEVVGGEVRITDLGSANGTLVNQVPIISAKLRGRETITLGRTRIVTQREADAPSPALSQETSFGNVHGVSREMRKLYPMFERLAASNAPVLLEGETGTGKEALAEALHDRSPRREGPFVVFDCTATPESLLEAHLFGYERGAFTGAISARAGVFEEANGGTLLIDEIGDLDVKLQPKLLRAAERGEFRRVGSSRPMRVDVRLVCATRRDLDLLVQEGRFRDDLFHRIAVTRVALPPLRQREGDVRFLAERFAIEFGADPASLGDDAIARWETHAWPGNVRELRNAVARVLALGELATSGGVEHTDAPRPALAVPGLGEVVQQLLARNLGFDDARQLLVGEFEREYLRRVLAQSGGVVSHAAEAAGIARRHFHRLLTRYRIG